MNRPNNRNIEEQKFQKGFVAVIPARGGSVGLPRKNLMEIQGISLIARAVLIAKRVKQVKWIIVSTDDREIALEAERAGATIPFLRPKALSQSDTPMLAVLKHAYEWLMHSNTIGDDICEGLVLLQPTSPMRKTKHVIGAIQKYKEARLKVKHIYGVQTVSPVPTTSDTFNLWRSAETSEGLKPGLKLKRINDSAHIQTLYYRNGAAVVLDTNKLETLTLVTDSVMPYIIDQPLVSIDTIIDFLRIEHSGEILEPDPREIGWNTLFTNHGKRR